MRKQHDKLVVVIGAFKLLKAVTLVALGIGALSMLHEDVVAVLTKWVHPTGHTMQKAVSKAVTLDDHKLRELGIGGLLYAVVFATEGIGLLLRKTWAEYLTVLVTTSFIPIEVYEMAEHKSVVKAIVIVVNIAIVVYLVLRLRADEHWPFKRRAAAAAAA